MRGCCVGVAVILRAAAARHRSAVLPGVFPVLGACHPPPPALRLVFPRYGSADLGGVVGRCSCRSTVMGGVANHLKITTRAVVGCSRLWVAGRLSSMRTCWFSLVPKLLFGEGWLGEVLLWWPQPSSQHSTVGVQVGQDPCDSSPADRRQEGRTARNPHFAAGSGAARSWAAECGGYRRSGKGKRGTVDFEASWVLFVLGTVRGSLLH